MLSLGWPSTIHSAAYVPAPPREDDPEDREAREDVTVLRARDGPHQAAAVRVCTVRAVDDRPGSRRRRTRDALAAAARLARSGRGRAAAAAVEALRDAVERPGQRVALERADEQAACLLAT
jgi:hypothetical protein